MKCKYLGSSNGQAVLQWIPETENDDNHDNRVKALKDMMRENMEQICKDNVEQKGVTLMKYEHMFAFYAQ